MSDYQIIEYNGLFQPVRCINLSIDDTCYPLSDYTTKTEAINIIRKYHSNPIVIISMDNHRTILERNHEYIN